MGDTWPASLVDSATAGRPAWLDDANPSLATPWDAVINRAEGLTLLLEVFSPVLDADYFNFYRQSLLVIHSPADVGHYAPTWLALVKLATHQMTYSGLGARAAGPMGGRGQRDRHAVRSRCNPDGLRVKIVGIRAILWTICLRQGTCTCLKPSLLQR